MGLVVLVQQCLCQRTPTISYITKSQTSKIGGTVQLDCSVLYGTEYPVLWVKLPPKEQCDGEAARDGFDSLDGDFRKAISPKCSPVPLSTNSALIVRDNRFRSVSHTYYFLHN